MFCLEEVCALCTDVGGQQGAVLSESQGTVRDLLVLSVLWLPLLAETTTTTKTK